MREGEYDSSIIGPVQTSAFRTSEEILEDVEELIALNNAIQPKMVQVTVEDGKVTLWGSVRDRIAVEEAVQAARQVIGVTEVENELEIG